MKKYTVGTQRASLKDKKKKHHQNKNIIFHISYSLDFFQIQLAKVLLH